MLDVYNILLKEYGPQGWWPLLNIRGSNPTKTGSVKGYHPGDYTYPRNINERNEIIFGAILTQNIAWPNVEKALINLQTINAIDPQRLLLMKPEDIGAAIRPAGHYNQKTQYLRNICSFLLSTPRIPSREELLKVKGIGQETADTILLFAYKQPEFIVDTYTRRVLDHFGIPRPEKYEEMKAFIMQNIPQEIEIFQELHALIVEHAKRVSNKKHKE